jgi:hypothetical protein
MDKNFPAAENGPVEWAKVELIRYADDLLLRFANVRANRSVSENEWSMVAG